MLAGCPTPPKQPPRVTPIIPIPQPPPPQPVQTNPPPEAPKAPVVRPIPSPVIPVDRWIPLESWNQMHEGEKPRRLKSATVPTFESRMLNGVLSLSVGSRMAYWNGLGFTLGFVPQLTNGQLSIHGLDAVKNLEPLLLPPTNHRHYGKRVIVLDPGHGGENTGAKSVINGGLEKDYTLDWAFRVQPLLASHGWKVFLTRTRDVDLTLAERVAFAEKVQADLFVSLHFNSINGGSSRAEHGGLESYCLTPVGMPSYLTRDFRDDPSRVFPNNAFDAQNLQYAFRLHQALVQFTDRKDRGVRRARFMDVLRWQNRPAVLLEAGYLSDPAEARLIASAGYRQKLAEAVAKALE